MSRSSLTDILETCLKRVEMGRSIDEVVAQYPNEARELRALLQMALEMTPKNGGMPVPASAQVDSRRRLLARAQELRDQRHAAGLWSILVLMRNHIGSTAFTALMVVLLFVALGSVKALPGDSLYPVKIAAEQAGISLAGNPEQRSQRETVYDIRRTDEVALMIRMKRTGHVSFGGLLNQSKKDSSWQVAGIPLELNPGLQKQTENLAGVSVEVKGYLNNQGKVQVDMMTAQQVIIQGSITYLETNGLRIGSQEIEIRAQTEIHGTPRLGGNALIQAARTEDENRFLAIRIEVSGGTEPAALETQTMPPTETSAPKITETPGMSSGQIIVTLPEKTVAAKSTDTPEHREPVETNQAPQPTESANHSSTPEPGNTQSPEKSVSTQVKEDKPAATPEPTHPPEANPSPESTSSSGDSVHSGSD